MAVVAVVILNWNGEAYLKQFLPSVVEHSNVLGAEIWVADNGSTDGSIALINDKFKSVKVLQLDKNYGFTGGYNRALKQIDAEYFVLLNSDVEVTKDWLLPILYLMEDHKDVAAAMPKLLAYNSKSDFEYAGAAGGFIDKYGYPFCRGRILSVLEADEGQYNKATEVFWATGACLFVRADLFHEVGGLDEEFFAHMEEIDLCWRLKNQGHKIMYVPESVVYHVGGGTLPNNNPRKLFLNYRNNLYLLYKNLPANRVNSTLLIRLVLDGISAILYLLQGKFKFFLAVPKAHFAFYSTKKNFKNKQKENRGKRVVKSHAEMFKKSIVFSFFLKKKTTFNQLDPKGWID